MSNRAPNDRRRSSNPGCAGYLILFVMAFAVLPAYTSGSLPEIALMSWGHYLFFWVVYLATTIVLIACPILVFFSREDQKDWRIKLDRWERDGRIGPMP